MALAGKGPTGNQILYLLGGTTTASTGDGALFASQHLNSPVLQMAITTTSTLDSVNLYLRSDVSGTNTNYKAIVTFT